MEYPHGYFADVETKEPLKFQEVSLRHLAGKPLSGILGWIFFWVKIPQYELLQDVLYITRPNREGRRRLILVEAGFVFNGGSVPFLFWWLYPPDQPDCLPAFVVHDLLCTPFVDDKYLFDSHVAHRYLRDACLANGASPTKADVIYKAVYLFGPKFKGVFHGD